MEKKSIDALKEDLKDHFWFLNKNQGSSTIIISISDFCKKFQWDLSSSSVDGHGIQILYDALDQFKTRRTDNNEGFYSHYLEPVDVFLVDYTIQESDNISVTLTDRAKYFFDNIHEMVQKDA